MTRFYPWFTTLLLVSACGGTFSSTQEHSSGGDTSGAGSPGAGSPGAGAPGAGAGSGGRAAAGASSGGASSGGASSGGSGGHVTPEPTQHRSEATACGVPPGTGAGGSAAQGAQPPLQTCTKSSECTAGPNGRCTSGRIGLYCSYDNCFADTDCAAGEVCLCSAPDGTGNRCTQPGCQVDADCPGSWCSPTFGTCGSYGGVTNYSCHTAADECVNDSDCTSNSLGGGYCMYDPQVTHWVCSTAFCAG